MKTNEEWLEALAASAQPISEYKELWELVLNWVGVGALLGWTVVVSLWLLWCELD